MDASERAALWIIATGVIVAGLYFLREPVTQFVLAVILWLTIDGVASAIRRRFTMMNPRLALPIAIVLVLGVMALLLYVLVINISEMASHAKLYEGSLNQKLADLYRALRLEGAAPTVGVLLEQMNPTQFIQQTGNALQSVVGSGVFILIFLGFLFSSSRVMTRKLDAIFPEDEQRAHVRAIVASIRGSMERYLWVQTVASAIATVLTFICLELIGLDNALFWAFLIFFLNYIPTIGSIVAVVLPTAFALVQFPDLLHVGLVALAVGIWQFIIGNFIQPRMTGESLNLSTVIVLLALAIWGALWGIAGAFLAAPLTVMLMIVLAQFPETRWIAILLSADGKPTAPKPPLYKTESKSD